MIYTREIEGFGNWRLDNNAPDKKWRLTFTVGEGDYRHRIAIYDSAERAAAAIGYGRLLHPLWDRHLDARSPSVPLSKWKKESVT
ncbi:MAG: hypothetical protein ABI273_03875 [Lacunisphaera sp.]